MSQFLVAFNIPPFWVGSAGKPRNVVLPDLNTGEASGLAVDNLGYGVYMIVIPILD